MIDSLAGHFQVGQVREQTTGRLFAHGQREHARRCSVAAAASPFPLLLRLLRRLLRLRELHSNRQPAGGAISLEHGHLRAAA